MNELLVVLTDFALAVLCMVYCWKLWSQPATRPELNRSFFGFFAAAGAYALLSVAVGSEVFNVDMTRFAILILIGVVSYNLWMIDVQLILPSSSGLNLTRWFFRALFLVYVLTLVLRREAKLSDSTIFYLPPLIILFLIISLRAVRERNRFYLLGVFGILGLFLAAWLQRHEYYFYGAPQLLGLWAFYLFGSRISRWTI